MERKNSFYGRATLFGVGLLFAYFSIVSIIGFIITLYVSITNNIGNSSLPFLCNSNEALGKLNQYNLALVGSIGTTLLGCSIYYIKKLYKLSLSGNFLMNILTNNDKLENWGTMLYFMFRPIFSISFTILMILGIKGGMITVAGKSIEVNSSFTDLTMFLAYFIGFSTGKFLSTLEKKSDKIIDTVLKEDSSSDEKTSDSH
ncbi:hypothetical protein Z962_p0074 (plasmid) [Clostridium botulinum C/D str. BKT12695]|nr:hypothetical protein Z962_p0074 [Clostridium botulinum C/D str. BKT12695]